MKTRSTIVARAEGGLGNQLFQIAATAAISGFPVTLDQRQERVWGRPLEGVIENSAVRTATTKQLLRLGWPKRRHATRWEHRIDSLVTHAARAGRFAPISSRIVAPSGPFDYYPVDAHLSKYLYLDGYFQNESYFQGVIDKVLEVLSPTLRRSAAVMSSLIEEPGSSFLVGVSFRRRCDYGDLGWLLPRQYYEYSLRVLADVIEAQHKRPLFVAFSDVRADDLALGQFGVGRWIDASPLAPAEQLGLLSRMNAVVCANSSFSWWGAWLAEQTGSAQTVIAPEPWLPLPGTPVPSRWASQQHTGFSKESGAFVVSETEHSVSPICLE